MQLKYRGQSYQTTAPSLETTVSEQPGIFLGHHFTIRQVQTLQRRQPVELTYRGVRYSH
ncbi:DUF4278 domain-containing protein [Sphaerothrix gracilis]|uniref:DUF4278 domain-containing protein n=1 Tax=Sphaerothrix gracilis TaxID=3151835 RepID=UPI0031FCDA99